MLSGMKGKKKLLFLIPAVLVLGLLIWNIVLQVELKKYKPQIEAYLPEDVYVAVGSTIELYNDEVVWSGLRVWLCLQLGLPGGRKSGGSVFNHRKRGAGG